MDSNITLNIVEPGSTPVVPNTGLFTSGVGGPEATIISAVIILTVATIIVTTLLYRKHKKQNKTTKLVHMVDTCKSIAKSKKRVTAGLSAIALLVSAGTFATLLSTTNKNNTNAAEGENTAETITPTVDGNELTIELGDEPVFETLAVRVTVAEALDAGYTLTAYTDSTDLVSTTDSSKVIPMIAASEGELASLTADTYGLSLAKAESQDEGVFTSLSTDADNPTIITDKDYKATEKNDVTTIYYGFYITPETPYGTYTSSDINYTVEANRTDLATVVYNGNGLYFDGNESKITNKARYEITTTDYTEKLSHTPNLNNDGEQIEGEYIHFGTYTNDPITIPGATKVKVSLKYGIYDGNYGNPDVYWAYMTMWQGNHPEYTAADDYDEGIRQCGDMTTSDGRINGYTYEPVTVECELPGDSVTFGFWTQPEGGPGIGYGYYAIVTGYDADGNIIHLPGNKLVSGEYIEPAQELPYVFLGWSEDKDANTATYESTKDIELNLSLTEGKTTNLYAVWQHATKIAFDGNGSDGGRGHSDVLLVAGSSMGFCNTSYGVTEYTKTGYAFNGWNTKPDGSGTAYSNCYQYTAPTNQSVEFSLYAQWTEPTIISFNGNGSDSGREIPDKLLAPGEHTDLCNNYQGPPAYTRTGYYFTGWNTAADGSGTSYENCDEYVAPDEPVTITLYAQWGPATTIIYDGNGGEGYMDSQTILEGNTGHLWANWYYREGYNFAGWNTKPDGSGTAYSAGEEITASDQSTIITLYAQWLPQ